MRIALILDPNDLLTLMISCLTCYRGCCQCVVATTISKVDIYKYPHGLHISGIADGSARSLPHKVYFKEKRRRERKKKFLYLSTCRPLSCSFTEQIVILERRKALVTFVKES